jgi:hypothetical protein
VPLWIAPTTCTLVAASAVVTAVLKISSADFDVMPLLAELLELLELDALVLVEPPELLPHADTATAATAATATADAVLLIATDPFGTGLRLRFDIGRPSVAVVPRSPSCSAPQS